MQSSPSFIKKIMSRQLFPPIVTTCLIFICVLGLTFLLSGHTLTLSKQNTQLYQSPSTDSQILKTLPSQSQVQLLKEDAGWYKVRLDGKTEGWIPAWYVEDEKLLNTEPIVAHILVDTDVHQATNDTSPIIDTLKAGTQIAIESESLGWTKIKTDTYTGFVKTRLITFSNDMKRERLTVDKPDLTEQALKDWLQVRASNQSFHTSADTASDIIYTVEPYKRFKYIDTVKSADGTEFYLAEDENGQRGYLDTRIVAKESDSLHHVNVPQATELANATIMLDAGHGGEDSGAIHESPHTQEKEVALSTTLALKDVLEQKGATVILTRSDDATLSLEERAQWSNRDNVDAFISIHFDDAIDPSWSGTTSYFYHEADQLMANMVNSELAKLKVDNNGVRFGNYHVLRENNRPSILLELGYMSNDEDVAIIRTSDYQQKAAEAIAQGLSLYFKNVHQQATQTPSTGVQITPHQESSSSQP